jgi:hypothetical protein
MRTASSSRRRTAVCVTLCESAYRPLLPLVVALRKSNIKAALKLNNLVNLKKLLSQAALWELFCGGQRESETLRGGEASEPSKFLILLKKQHLPWKKAVPVGVMSVGVMECCKSDEKPKYFRVHFFNFFTYLHYSSTPLLQ